MCLGYEAIALLLYLIKIYNINDIINDISFMFLLNIRYNMYGSYHLYIPDFYIKTQNLIIEIKSEYTYNPSKEVMYKNLKKAEASILNNYNFLLIIVYKNKKNIIIKIIEKTYENIKTDFEKNYQ